MLLAFAVALGIGVALAAFAALVVFLARAYDRIWRGW